MTTTTRNRFFIKVFGPVLSQQQRQQQRQQKKKRKRIGRIDRKKEKKKDGKNRRFAVYPSIPSSSLVLELNLSLQFKSSKRTTQRKSFRQGQGVAKQEGTPSHWGGEEKQESAKEQGKETKMRVHGSREVEESIGLICRVFFSFPVSLSLKW